MCHAPPRVLLSFDQRSGYPLARLSSVPLRAKSGNTLFAVQGLFAP
jgi:hypothetical protein